MGFLNPAKTCATVAAREAGGGEGERDKGLSSHVTTGIQDLAAGISHDLRLSTLREPPSSGSPDKGDVGGISGGSRAELKIRERKTRPEERPVLGE